MHKALNIYNIENNIVKCGFCLTELILSENSYDCGCERFKYYKFLNEIINAANEEMEELKKELV